ncbi:MAG TPA: DNA double-strand break repair nuclease NurA [Clostridiaceae bacterium]|nr:DNA double-strand break repair nuclease NurA [Clostridiaceae bacterium]
MDSDKLLFTDLPAALVEELLNEAVNAGSGMLKTFQEFKENRDKQREELIENGLIINESDLGYPLLPTTCGVDGSYAIERLLTADFIASAAVAVEGLTPPSEKRYWEKPSHSVYVSMEVHNPDTATILRAVMLGRELQLAVKAPHDIVMLDGTITLPIIYFNQALNRAPESLELKCSQEFLKNSLEYLEAYISILTGIRSDKHYVAIPKYSTRREISKLMNWNIKQDDRGLLTAILRPGEMTRPLPLEKPAQPWHLNTKAIPNIGSKASVVEKQIIDALYHVYVCHYKPHSWLPAIRLEFAESVATNKYRLATLIQGIKHQCAAASMLEPFPIYLADRMVKALSRSMPAFRQIAAQYISEKYDGDIGEVFFAMHGYRSEAGG